MRRWLFFLIPALALAGLITWRVNQKKAEAAGQAAQRQARAKMPVIVEAAPVKRQDVVTTFEAVGSTEAPFAVDVIPKLPGRIVFLEVREGDRVTAGQIVARLDPNEVEGEVRRWEATVAQARARLAEARLNENATDVTARTDVRREQEAVATAQAQERQARADYDTKIAAAQAAVTDAQGRISAAEATIEAAEAAIASAEANLANARTRLERQQMLFREGATAKQLLDDAQTVVDVQQSAVNEARKRREAAVAARDSAVAQRKAAEKQVAVARNQARATLDVGRAAVRQAQANLEAARANTSRRPAYDQNLAALEAAVRSAEGDLKSAQARRAGTILRSPLDGVVTRRFLDRGALATPTTSIMQVQEIRSLWVTIGVPEEISRRLATGQSATVRFDAFPGRQYGGVIERIEPVADPQSRQFTARIRVANEEGRLRPGTFARVTLETQKAPNVLVVPREAVQTPRDPNAAPTVIVVKSEGEGQVAEAREVRTGLTDGKMVAIESGLQDGEQVVILTGRSLKDGQAIKVGGQGGPPGGGQGGGESGGAPGNRAEGRNNRGTGSTGAGVPPGANTGAGGQTR
jgi:HlyD family secretion protein